MELSRGASVLPHTKRTRHDEMLFTGDFRTRRRKVDLGGRSKHRVRDAKSELEEARRLREQRQRQRVESNASTVIGKFARSRLVARKAREAVRAAWIEENGSRGEIAASDPDAGRAAVALRQAIFFVVACAASPSLS